MIVGASLTAVNVMLRVVAVLVSTPSFTTTLIVRWVAQVSAQPLESVREEVAAQLASFGASAARPEREALGRVLDAAERSLGQKGAPPDLALSMASFRRWLAEL